MNLYYIQQDDQIMSFNNQLDLFYSGWLDDTIKNTVVRFFHAQLLDLDDFKIFQSNFRKVNDSHKKLNRNHTNPFSRLVSLDDHNGDQSKKIEQSKVFFQQHSKKIVIFALMELA